MRFSSKYVLRISYVKFSTWLIKWGGSREIETTMDISIPVFLFKRSALFYPREPGRCTPLFHVLRLQAAAVLSKQIVQIINKHLFLDLKGWEFPILPPSFEGMGLVCIINKDIKQKIFLFFFPSTLTVDWKHFRIGPRKRKHREQENHLNGKEQWVVAFKIFILKHMNSLQETAMNISPERVCSGEANEIMA